MKRNNTKISGVVHQQKSAKHYDLRRYFPEPEFETLIEQFWFVDWDLCDQPPHLQKNLPDPNFHLLIEDQKVKVIGPVSKAYQYKMQNKGKILGVKFVAGGLAVKAEFSAHNFVDKTVAVDQIMNIDESKLLADINGTSCDEEKVSLFQEHLRPSLQTPNDQQRQAAKLLFTIKHHADITSVEELAAYSGLRKRTLQRVFQQYVGLSPKLLLRKYRLHQAMAYLDDGSKNILDIVEWLGYTDQSHLIRDFKDMLGVTPKQYCD